MTGAVAGRRADPRRLALWAGCCLLLLFLIAPVAVVAATSFGSSPYMAFPPAAFSLRWYRNFFASAQWIGPTLLSLRIALATMLAATLLGTLAAIGIVRGRFPGRTAVELFLLSPMVVPIVVMALGLYFLFSAYGLVGSPVAIWLGHVLIATPLVIILVRAGLRVADPSLELAARSLGANYWRALWFVTLPVLRPAILSAAVFSFLISFDEVVIAIFLGGPDATTLPKRMWETIRFEIDPTLTAISSLLTLVAILVLVGAELARRGPRRARPGD